MILSVMFSPFVFHNFSPFTYFSMLNIFKMTHTIATQIGLHPHIGQTCSWASPPHAD